MKRTKKFIIASMVLTLLVALALSGCSKSKDAAGTDKATPSKVSSAQDGPMTKYDPPITIEFVRSTNPIEQQRLSKLKELTGETLEDNRWTRAFRDELGINIKYRWFASGDDQFNQKWKLALASGNIPDVSSVALTDLKQLVQTEQIVDMTPYIDKYMSPLTKEVTYSDGDSIMKAITFDGKRMAMPQVTAALDSYRYLFMRTDWLKKLGLSEPKTADELVNTMLAFTKNDPDGNGKSDTIGLTVDKDLWYTLEGFFWCFGAYPDAWLKNSDGKLIPGWTQPEMKEPLRALQRLYKEGAIDKEFPVKDYPKAIEQIAAGKAGITFGGHWAPQDALLPNHENDPNADWGSYTLPGKDGKPAIGELELGMGNALAVKKDFKHPEAVVKMLNLFFEKLYGTTGDYEYWGNGDIDAVWSIGPLAAFHPLINVIPYRDIQKVFNGEMKEPELKGASKDYYKNVMSKWQWDKMFGKGEHTSGFQMNKIASNRNLVFTNNFVGAPTDTMVKKNGPLKELQTTTFVKIITGALDVDKGFDNYVSEWNRLGGEQIIKEVNDWYVASSRQ